MMVGKNITEIAKMIGITPAVLTRMGKKLEREATVRLPPAMRWADWMGTFRTACCTSMMPAVTISATAAKSTKGR